MWVHGNAFVPQYPAGAGPEGTNGHRLVQVQDPALSRNVPWSDLVGLRAGPFLRFRAERGNTNFFHAVIPTPAILPEVGRAGHAAISVDAVSLHWSATDARIRITRLFVFSGTDQPTPVPIAPEGISLLRGNPPAGVQRLPGANFFALTPPLTPRSPGEGLPFAIGLSVLVDFQAEGEVDFTSAGIHFAI